MTNVAAIILARGGSEGIPQKNIIDFCGKPLIVWTIEQLQQAKVVSSIWVSSDSEKILSISRDYGVDTIQRPPEISSDDATSESGWLHALEIIENKTGPVDIVIAPQVTSPLREPEDFKQGLHDFQKQKRDSMFSCSVAEDLFFWEQLPDGNFNSVSYDYKNRKRRQNISKKYIENGSFYLFKPEVLRKYGNRLGGNIGIYIMDRYKMFQIDDPLDVTLCQVVMLGYKLDK